MSLFSVPKQFQNDEKGRSTPLASYDFYDTATFDRKATYSDSGLTSVNPNPVIADGAGRFPKIYLSVDSAYRTVFSERIAPNQYKQISLEDDVIGSLDSQDTARQVHGGQFMTYGVTADAITLTSVNTVALTAVATGDLFRFRATAANTGATTINPDGIAAVACLTVTGVALPADYIRTDVDTVCVYDGTNYIVQREIESGTNANGEFTRWEDGRQSCEIEHSEAMVVATEIDLTYTFPKAFTATPKFSHTISDNTGGTLGAANGDIVSTIGESLGTTTSGRVRMLSVSGFTFAATGDMNISTILTGAWY